MVSLSRKSNTMKHKLKLAALVIFLVSFVSAKAQNAAIVETPKDKKKIELRPNSMDYGPVKRDNVGSRVDRVKDKNLYSKRRPVNNHKLLKPNIKRDLKRDQRIQRKQRLIQRRTLNR